MSVHKLQFDDFEEGEYDLLAIHTNLEDYRLAFFLNKALPLRLRKAPEAISISSRSGQTWFSRFVFEDADTAAVWDLVGNKSEYVSTVSTGATLFGTTGTVTTKAWLLPEFRKADYFLKIENAPCPAHEAVQKIQSIDRVSVVYAIGSDMIKSKNNLIF
jgi:hypothetical protein